MRMDRIGHCLATAAVMRMVTMHVWHVAPSKDVSDALCRCRGGARLLQADDCRVMEVLGSGTAAGSAVDGDDAAAGEAEPDKAAEGRSTADGRRERCLELALVLPARGEHLDATLQHRRPDSVSPCREVLECFHLHYLS